MRNTATRNPKCKTRIVLALSVALAALAASRPSKAQAPLQIGDLAPEVRVARWVKGQPIKRFSEGKVYVVEFWATWSAPSRRAFPVLTRLAAKYEGRVTFVGVSVLEVQPGDTTRGYMDRVASFVREMGDRMDFNVAVDGPEASMTRAWLAASGEVGVPVAFVVDQDGKIAWIDHPANGLDSALEKVLAGDWDARAFAGERAKRKAEEEKRRQEGERATKLSAPVIRLRDQGNYRAAFAELKRVLAANPQIAAPMALLRLDLLFKVDERQGYTFLKYLFEHDYKDNPQALNGLAHRILDDSQLKMPDYELANSAAQRAADLTRNENGVILDTLATALFKRGSRIRAVEVEEKALALLQKDDEASEEIVRAVRTRLDQFERAVSP